LRILKKLDRVFELSASEAELTDDQTTKQYSTRHKKTAPTDSRPGADPTKLTSLVTPKAGHRIKGK